MLSTSGKWGGGRGKKEEKKKSKGKRKKEKPPTKINRYCNKINFNFRISYLRLFHSAQISSLHKLWQDSK